MNLASISPKSWRHFSKCYKHVATTRAVLSAWPLNRATISSAARPTRSVLYTPGSSKHLNKARTAASDATLIDLEDGVAPAAKAHAREAVLEVLNKDFGDKLVTVRVNSPNSVWGSDDLQAIAKEKRVDAIVLPKVESAAEVQEIGDFLERNAVNADIRIWAMIETPKGVQRVNDIAGSHRRISTLVMGTTDLTRDLRSLHVKDRMPLLYSLSRCLLAARAAGKQILDGVHLDLEDSTGFELSCRQGKEMGFDGKTLIHPSTIPVANWFFGPSAEEVEQSYRIVAAMEEATAQGLGACLLDGKLIEQLHSENAVRVIQLHEAIQVFEEASAAAHMD